MVESNRDLVEDLRDNGLAAVCGDASEESTLVQAHVARAAMLIIAIPEVIDAMRMAGIARTLNPAIEVVLRTHGEDESDLLRRDHIGTVFFGEEELARGMSQHVLGRFNVMPAKASRTQISAARSVGELRDELSPALAMSLSSMPQSELYPHRRIR